MSESITSDEELNHYQGRQLRKKRPELNWQNALDLEHRRLAIVYKRQSTTEQVKNSLYSLLMQDALEDLAIEDGYSWILTQEERRAVREAEGYPGWYQNGQVVVEERDLGISGTLGQEERLGLAHIVRLIESDRTEAIYVVHISRLFRDQTLIDAFSFGELCKTHDVKIITPMMRLNLGVPMHMEYYRREADWAAKELEVMRGRLLDARKRKAQQGRWAGGYLPVGYILDEREEVDGRSNPDWHKYIPYEPHARVVRIIFERLRLPGMTGHRVARWCHNKGIRFDLFPPELAERYTPLTALRNIDSGGGWPVTVHLVNGIASNLAYIGWWFWGGELIRKNNHLPIIDEETFWIVQANLNSRRRGPNKTRGPRRRQSMKKVSQRPDRKKDSLEPFPLTGLLFCKCAATPRKMECHGSGNGRRYRCVELPRRERSHAIVAKHVEDAVGDFVLERCAFPEYAEMVLERLQAEYDQAREQAAAVAREVARLDQEIGNLQHNFSIIKLTPERAAQLDVEIQARITRKRELSQLNAYPVGQIAQSVNTEDVRFARDMLSDLCRLWPEQTNELKNIFLRLILERVEIEGVKTAETDLRTTIRWRSGAWHVIEITVPRRSAGHKPWTLEEDALIREHYTKGHEAIAPLLPNRKWRSIVMRSRKLGIYIKTIQSNNKSWQGIGSRISPKNRLWTGEEEEVVRKWIAGEIKTGEACQQTGRTEDALRWRASVLGLKASERPVTWRLLDSSDDSGNDDDPDGDSRWAR